MAGRSVKSPVSRADSGGLDAADRAGPDFIAVGPEKTGTTWMHKQLDGHPSVELPPVKELRYFWEKDSYPTETLWQRMTARTDWHRAQYWQVAMMFLALPLLSPIENLIRDRRKLAWCYRYVMRPHDDEWYLSCFDRTSPRVLGEVSPQYFFLKPPRIQAIHELIPNTKVIISLRKPIDWVWSLAKMNARVGTLEPYYGSLDKFIDFHLERRSFSRSLGHWQEHFPPDQLLVLFYDDLAEDPWKYYERICSFLGISPQVSRKKIMREKINIGGLDTLPERFVERIREGWRDDIVALSSMVPDLPRSWLD